MVCSPSVATLKKLNRLAFTIMGDMSWHCHMGIHTVPMQVAAERGIPIVIWGEHGFLAADPNGIALYFGHLLPEKVESAAHGK